MPSTLIKMAIYIGAINIVTRFSHVTGRIMAVDTLTRVKAHNAISVWLTILYRPLPYGVTKIQRLVLRLLR